MPGWFGLEWHVRCRPPCEASTAACASAAFSVGSPVGCGYGRTAFFSLKWITPPGPSQTSCSPQIPHPKHSCPAGAPHPPGQLAALLHAAVSRYPPDPAGGGLAAGYHLALVRHLTQLWRADRRVAEMARAALGCPIPPRRVLFGSATVNTFCCFDANQNPFDCPCQSVSPKTRTTGFGFRRWFFSVMGNVQLGSQKATVAFVGEGAVAGLRGSWGHVDHLLEFLVDFMALTTAPTCEVRSVVCPSDIFLTGPTLTPTQTLT